jgi:hypothetical protein
LGTLALALLEEGQECKEFPARRDCAGQMADLGIEAGELHSKRARPSTTSLGVGLRSAIARPAGRVRRSRP